MDVKRDDHWTSKSRRSHLQLSTEVSLVKNQTDTVCVKEAYSYEQTYIFNWVCTVTVKYFTAAENSHNLPWHYEVFDNAYIPALTSSVFHKEIN